MSSEPKSTWLLAVSLQDNGPLMCLDDEDEKCGIGWRTADKNLAVLDVGHYKDGTSSAELRGSTEPPSGAGFILGFSDQLSAFKFQGSEVRY